MKSFWMCVIEVEHDEGTMPNGMDLAPRLAAEEAIAVNFKGCKIISNCSGWALNQRGADKVRSDFCKDEFVISSAEAVRR